MTEDRVNKYVVSERILKWAIKEAYFSGSIHDTHASIDEIVDSLSRYKKKPLNSNFARGNGRYGPCFVSLTPKEKRELCKKK